jgi:carotenoid cleavage dioxygenase-like enzyme
MPSPTDPSKPPSQNVELDVLGALPAVLSGRLVGVSRDGTVHSLDMHGERLTYSVRRFHTDAVIHSLFRFGTSMLAFGEGASAYELDTDNGTLVRVDLAGHGRMLAAYPRQDLATGELHLVADDTDGGQAYIVVSAGAMTRRSRPIVGASCRIHGVSLSRDHTIFVADGLIGVTPRDGESRTTWIATDAAAPHPVYAHDTDGGVALLALTPSLERWMLQPDSGTIKREVLDDSPRRFAHLRADAIDAVPKWLWTTGGDTIGRHDLVHSRHTHRRLHAQVPGDFVVVAGTTPPVDINGGWLIGFVRKSPDAVTELHVSDAADITATAVATAGVPRPIPLEVHFTWISSIQIQSNSVDDERSPQAAFRDTSLTGSTAGEPRPSNVDQQPQSLHHPEDIT